MVYNMFLDAMILNARFQFAGQKAMPGICFRNVNLLEANLTICVFNRWQNQWAFYQTYHIFRCNSSKISYRLICDVIVWTKSAQFAHICQFKRKVILEFKQILLEFYHVCQVQQCFSHSNDDQNVRPIDMPCTRLVYITFCTFVQCSIPRSSNWLFQFQTEHFQ